MPQSPGTYASFNTTEGKITVRLFESDAPVTVKNFIELAEGNQAKAARWLGISLPTMREKLRLYELHPRQENET